MAAMLVAGMIVAACSLVIGFAGAFLWALGADHRKRRG